MKSKWFQVNCTFLYFVEGKLYGRLENWSWSLFGIYVVSEGLNFLLRLCMWMESMFKLGWEIIFLWSIWKIFFFSEVNLSYFITFSLQITLLVVNIWISQTHFFLYLISPAKHCQYFFFFFLLAATKLLFTLLISISCSRKCFTSQCFTFPFHTTV